MSDTRRYRCEYTDLAPNELFVHPLEDYETVVVLEDDHIAEIKEHMAIADGHYVNEHNLREENKKLQAHIDELEEANTELQFTLNNIKAFKNQIIAEGIKEMNIAWCNSSGDNISYSRFVFDYANSLRGEE